MTRAASREAGSYGAGPSVVERGDTRADRAPHVTLTLWTADVTLATAADAAGIDRIGLDLETRGKAARQESQSSWISAHVEGDLARVRSALRRGQLFVRVDALGPHSLDQLERVLRHGVEVVMVPMAEDPVLLGDFAAAVAGRARVVALIETTTGVDRIDELAGLPGVDEVHLGINDLSISLGIVNRFAVLLDDASTAVAAAVHAAGKPLGVAHIGRPLDPDLPVPADLVYAQLPRLGATATLLGRSFLRGGSDLASVVAGARRRLAEWWSAGPVAWDAAAGALAEWTREPLPLEP